MTHLSAANSSNQLVSKRILTIPSDEIETKKYSCEQSLDIYDTYAEASNIAKGRCAQGVRARVIPIGDYYLVSNKEDIHTISKPAMRFFYLTKQKKMSLRDIQIKLNQKESSLVVHAVTCIQNNLITLTDVSYHSSLNDRDIIYIKELVENELKSNTQLTLKPIFDLCNTKEISVSYDELKLIAAETIRIKKP
jgi:hypothetical protein